MVFLTLANYDVANGYKNMFFLTRLSWYRSDNDVIKSLSTRRSCCHGGLPELNCQQMSRTWTRHEVVVIVTLAYKPLLRAATMEGDIVNEISLNRVQYTKCLGVQIDESFTWVKHTEYTIKTIVCNISILRKISSVLTLDNKIAIYR